ncbi:hypothetical protein [Reinekea marinisedimentorum]|uniref:Lipoprotein n=1 Tax=Reinekea marinisedimentorum TaxID=230495 RepID=A0A4R3IDC4_9GAMM|nr:hypothetical protein [Reinekea marinisedimentorum]TCS43766.1 hypothetical protein BCF53_101109 [Reinekea marinisedimentorum]
MKTLRIVVSATLTAALLSSCSSPFIYEENLQVEETASGYLCDIAESISTEHNGKEYKMVNQVNRLVETKRECQLENLAGDINTRSVYVHEQNDQWQYDSQLTFVKGAEGFPFLKEWVLLKQNKKDHVDLVFINSLEALPYAFDRVTEMKSAGTSYWLKSRVNTLKGEESRMQSFKGGYRYTEENTQGILLEQCSQNGLQWFDC